MSLKTAIVLTIMVLAGAFGDVLVSKGMKQVGEITSAQPAMLLRAGIRAAHNPFVVTGVLGLAVYFFSFSTVLSWEDVSLVVPISALSFLLTTFVAQRSLGEHVTPQRWCGTILIVLGVVLVARSQGGSQTPTARRQSPVTAKLTTEARRHRDPESRGSGKGNTPGGGLFRRELPGAGSDQATQPPHGLGRLEAAAQRFIRQRGGDPRSGGPRFGGEVAVPVKGEPGGGLAAGRPVPSGLGLAVVPRQETGGNAVRGPADIQEQHFSRRRPLAARGR